MSTKLLFRNINICHRHIGLHKPIWRHILFPSSSCLRSLSSEVKDGRTTKVPHYIDASDSKTENIFTEDMIVHENFLSIEEEKSLLEEIEPFLKRMRYEYDHWDDAIHGYRETERREWNPANQTILNRVREISFPPGTPQIDFTHILDIKKDGYIKPHVDSVRFCGRTIAGLCLLSPCVMRLVREEDKSQYGDILLNTRSLYIMRDRARYEFSHEVLSEDNSKFKGELVPRDRRISIMCRNQPQVEKKQDS